MALNISIDKEGNVGLLKIFKDSKSNICLLNASIIAHKTLESFYPMDNQNFSLQC
jgi:hypothetical protein